MVLGRDSGNWILTNLVFAGLGIQFGQASGLAVVEGSPQPGGISLFMLTKGLSAMTGNGRRFDELSVLVAGPEDEFCLAADAPRNWCSLYIPNDALATANRDEPAANGARRGVRQLPTHSMERFRSLIQQLDIVVQQEPNAFQSPAAQMAARGKLLPEIRTMLALPTKAEPTFGRHIVPRHQIIRMSMDFVDQHDRDHVSVGELATAAGVSERTLRDAFQGYFGVSPVRYLKRRTLHQVRAALKSADPSAATVTGIATEFGIWELGRFSRDYSTLFGELPSETLRSS